MRLNSTLWVTLTLVAAPILGHGQVAFTNMSNLLSNTTASGGCMGVVDMNGDGLDDIAKLHNSDHFYVDYQNADGTFTLVDYGVVANEGQWGMTLGDVNNDGHKDLVCGGSYDGVHFLSITEPGTSTLSDLNNGSLFTQCVNMADINNDGFNDYFACHDDGPSRIWINNQSGSLIQNDYMDNTTNPTSDMSGNYGSVWIDFDNDNDLDLFIAHCRQGVNNVEDPRRWDRLFVNDGNNNYTDMAAEYGLQNKSQSWTGDFGDIDNDGDLDQVLTTHDGTIELFENDGTGHFTDATSGCGMEVSGFFLQSKFVDLDNDGYVDVLIAGGSGSAYVFMNNGNKTFSAITNPFPANKTMHSFATGDVNNDGFQDVFANYGDGYIGTDPNNPDRLWMNNTNDNHWFTVRLQGVESNRDAIGARVTIEGPWGTQIREVRAGESYGIVTSFACNFGLGSATVIPTMTINWPSGLVETFTDIASDQTLVVIEDECISPSVAITTSGEPIICGNGDSVTLTADAGFNYTWSNAETSQSITVTEAGSYMVTVDDGTGCTGSASIFVQQSPDETPSVAVVGETEFCEGGSVELTSSSASGYTWTGGATTQSISVTSAGSYTVTIDGTCGAFTSDAISVSVLDTPDAPSGTGASIAIGNSAQISAVGDNITWYDQAVGGTVIGTGNTYTTPTLNTTTSYWVSSSAQYGGGQAFGGRTDNSATGAYHTNADNYQVFSAFEDFTIVSVKVYANGAGNRTIALTNYNTGATIATGSFSVPDGESRVDINFDVPAGGPYGLRVVGGDPQLWRDALGSNPAYPYALGTVGEITSSSVGGANATEYYYFFYDWEVSSEGVACEGPLTEVVVFVGTVGVDENNSDGLIQVFPNPAHDNVTVSFGDVKGKVSVELMDVTGRLIQSTNVDADVQQGGRLDLDLQELSRGEYLIRVQHAEGTSVHHIVLQ
ncbi:MAG: FG-GAP-like repeat-containing protein [Flavobacteriales bacterium]|nr:VCBS repeat-containing protein [Flavobacteriales bacterium]